MKIDFDIADKMIVCTIKEGNKIYEGIAACHPEDDYNERIGKNIAYYRAALKQAKELKAESVIEYKTVKQLYDAIRLNPKFNEDGMEIRIISKRLNNLDNEIKDWKFCVSTLKKQISEEIHSRAIYNRLKAGLNKAKE